MAFSQWTAGQRITAARLAAMSPKWADWTPTWTTSTGAGTPSFGNATVIARYAQCADVVHFRMEITFGSTTTFGGGGGSDNWRFSVPVTAAGTALIIGYGELTDTSVGSGSRMGARPRLTTTTTLEVEMASARIDAAAVSGVGLIDAVSPWTWANGDTIRLFGAYEAA